MFKLPQIVNLHSIRHRFLRPSMPAGSATPKIRLIHHFVQPEQAELLEQGSVFKVTTYYRVVERQWDSATQSYILHLALPEHYQQAIAAQTSGPRPRKDNYGTHTL